MKALQNPVAVYRELNNRSFYHFLQHFWHLVSPHTFEPNWHIELLCTELEQLAYKVGNREPRDHDLIINVPPGSTKTITCSIMFPIWCWTKWYWMKFICASYSGALALESADYCREILRSQEFREVYPEIHIKEDKDTKSNFKIVKKEYTTIGRLPRTLSGGNRFSTSVGATLTGYHGDILIVDDPLNPTEAVSDVERNKANHWCEQTLSTRKTNKDVTPILYIMQRLHQDDPSGHILTKEKENVRHICLPGEIRNFKDQVKPQELIQFYKGELMDPKRLPWRVLNDLEADLGQYGYAGQIGQNPVPPGGGMFQVDHFTYLTQMPHQSQIISTVRYWDKAASPGEGMYTVGVKMSRLTGNRLLVEDVKRGKWGSAEREDIILQTARADGKKVVIWIEQEPGSGGKESAESTVRNLMGFVCKTERPSGDKVFRADPYSVQVNIGNVSLMTAYWNKDFVDEHKFFPFGTYKDQVDATGGAFNKLIGKKMARRIT